ncbi:MAG: hypothetical protein GY811_29340 [Myxococcales bacterium]|nr:hypothetical protein [Myxococcales bacterium]
MSFVPSVEVGDIILTNKNAERGCDYLGWAENLLTQFRYCHAMLVTGHDKATGISIVEAYPPYVRVVENKQYYLSDYTDTKLAVLRVVGEDGEPLSPELKKDVVDKGLSFESIPYVFPPIDIEEDPKEGLYCSMLVYRSYLDAAGIDLDGWFPGIVTPDELYASDRTVVVFEAAPEDS